MPHPHERPVNIREYKLIPRDRLAGTMFVLATDEGEPITYQKKMHAVPGYPQDPRTDTRTANMFSVSVRESDSMSTKCQLITEALRQRLSKHPCVVRAKIHGILVEWHVSQHGVQRVSPGSTFKD